VTLAADAAVTPEPEAIHVRARSGALLRSAMRLWRTRIGLVLFLVVGAFAVFGPFVAPHSATEFAGAPNTGRSADAFFGTDYLGHDVWSRFLWGGRQILAMAIAATAIGLATGVLVGLVAAYSRNALDDVLMRAMDVVLAFPQIMLTLVLVVTLGPSYWLIVLAVGVSTMPRVARVIRGAAQPIVERDFVAAAEALGVPRWRILFVEILPNVLSALMVEASLRLTFSIGLVASIAFLGFTPDPTGSDWGLMIFENRLLLVVQPWGVVLPLAAIAILTIGSGLIGDGIARAAIGIDRKRGGE
jgi:peptide/nickel transport system permease protein